MCDRDQESWQKARAAATAAAATTTAAAAAALTGPTGRREAYRQKTRREAATS